MAVKHTLVSHAAEFWSSNLVIAGLGFVGILIWRSVTIGMHLGRLTTQVKHLREELSYMRERFDDHIDKTKGE